MAAAAAQVGPPPEMAPHQQDMAQPHSQLEGAEDVQLDAHIQAHEAATAMAAAAAQEAAQLAVQQEVHVLFSCLHCIVCRSFCIWVLSSLACCAALTFAVVTDERHHSDGAEARSGW